MNTAAVTKPGFDSALTGVEPAVVSATASVEIRTAAEIRASRRLLLVGNVINKSLFEFGWPKSEWCNRHSPQGTRACSLKVTADSCLGPGVTSHLECVLARTPK